MLQSLQASLASRGVRYERIEHPEAFTAQEEASATRVSGWSWAKVVIVKERDGLAMAVLPACCTIDLNRLKGLIGRGELRLANVEEILRTFPDCAVGAIPPFGRLFGVPTFAEEALVGQRDIVMPAGDHRTAIRMRAPDYVRLDEPRLGQFAIHEGETFPAHPTPRGRAGRRGAGAGSR